MLHRNRDLITRDAVSKADNSGLPVEAERDTTAENVYKALNF